MRPVVVRIEVHLFARAPPGLQQQTVVVLRAAIIILSQISEICRRIRQIEQAALVHVTRGRTNRVRNWTGRRIECARGQPEELGGIELNRIPDVRYLGSDIVHGCEHARLDLPLDAKIPRVLGRCFHVRWHR